MKKITTFFICLLMLVIQVAKAGSQNLYQRLTKADSIMMAVARRTLPAKATPAPTVTASVSSAPAADTAFVPLVENPITSGQSLTYKHRLDSIKKEVPLDYNEYVQTYIDIYTGPNRKSEMGKILGLTKYYFPIYEKAFRDAGIPEEIKFLSVVESALNPYAVSRVGATGPWQFMFTTGKLYGLTIDNYVDERRDPIQASYAAAAYIKDAYQDFGDWLVAIASYNCGKGNITRAIQKAGASDFWSIRKFLPAETRNYVPAYIAIAYVMNYYQKHGIYPQQCNFSVKTDTVLVNKYVSLASISNVSHIDMAQLSILNPQYKKLIINGTDAAPKRLVIPQIDKLTFASLYDALNNPAAVASNFEPIRAVNNDYAAIKAKKVEKTESKHKVRSGETLSEIADDFGVEVQDLKAWNHLRKATITPGQVLVVAEPAAGEEKNSSKQKETKTFFTYKVRRGDTLSQIAEKFDGATVEQIKELNGAKVSHLTPGMTLKISKG